MEHGLEGQYVIKENKKLRFGYTTGSCAAAAAQASVRMLFSQESIPIVRLTTPKGFTLFLEPLEEKWSQKEACCAIRKDAGDDPDVTDGLLVYASVRKCGREEAKRRMKLFYPEGRKEAPKETERLKNSEDFRAAVCIRGGIGVGTVTLPGLEQPVGAPAINPVPRDMIIKEVQAVCKEYGYKEGIEVTISAPAGVELAEKTFNPRLGIQNGISILGTSGIVEPMSEKALVATIELEMRQKAADRKYLLITPGNYGVNYLKNHFPFGPEAAVKCSNYVGQTIDMAVNMELEGVLFVAHIGKFVKVAGGIMNTHSREADARMEILSSCAVKAGINGDRARQILSCVTTDEGLRVISESGVWEKTMDILITQIEYYLNHRAQNRLKAGAVVFSNVFGELGRTKAVPELLERMESEKVLHIE